MKKTILSLMALYLLQGSAYAQTTSVLYEPTTLVLGISNAVVYDNKITVAVGTESTPQPAGYPDTSLWAKKGYLLNEDSLITTSLFQNGAFHTFDVDMEITPSNKLALVYQYPTGTDYGFRMPYKEWDGTTYTANETVFSNENWGHAPKLDFVANNAPRIVSFAHAGYALVYHDRPTTNWSNFLLTNYGTNYTPAASIAHNNMQYLLTRNNTTPPHRISLFTHNGNGWSSQAVSVSSQNACDVAVHDNKVYALYIINNTLRLAQRSVLGGLWTMEDVIIQDSIYHRATVFFDDDNTPYVAYISGQLNGAFKVMKKENNTWNTIFSKTDLNFLSDYWSWGRRPSLLKKENDIYAVYSDNYRVYLTNLTANPTSLANTIHFTDEISIFPSPNNGKFSVQGEGIQHITVLDVTGKVILTQKVNNESLANINLQNVSQGVYLVRILTTNGITTKKVIVE